MSSDDLGFLQAIAENPDDDVQRLIFADWLDERGDRRGPFLRVQMELATLEPDDPARAELEVREREHFYAASEAYWRSMPLGIGRYFLVASPRFYSRGCLSLVEVSQQSLAQFTADAETLFRYAPIEEVLLEPPVAWRGPVTIPALRGLLKIPEVARLRGLRLVGPFSNLDGIVETLCKTQALPQLRRLWFGNMHNSGNTAGLSAGQFRALRATFPAAEVIDGGWSVI